MERCAAVYLGSRPGTGDYYTALADGLGRLLAGENIQVVYGGANVGTMRALADGVLAAGGKITGVMPVNFRCGEVRHPGVKIVDVADLAERKKVMEKMSTCAIVMPGSFGTMDELFGYAVDRHLQYHRKRIIVFNPDGFYNPLLELFARMEKAGFLTREYKEYILVRDNLADVVRAVI